MLILYVSKIDDYNYKLFMLNTLTNESVDLGLGDKEDLEEYAESIASISSDKIVFIENKDIQETQVEIS